MFFQATTKVYTMLITISGLNGLFIGTLKAEKGMSITNGVVTKVNNKSILVKNHNTDSASFNGEVKLDELSMSICAVDPLLVDKILDKNNNPYKPNDVEQALITLAGLEAHETMLAIGSLANHVKNTVNLREERIHDVYGSLSEYTLASTIDHLVNQ